MPLQLEKIVRKNIWDLPESYSPRFDNIAEKSNSNIKDIGGFSAPQSSYTEAPHDDLRSEIAKFHSIDKSQIFIGVGLDEAVDLLIRIFCKPGTDNIITTPPTYSMYETFARLNDVQNNKVPLTPNFDIDFNALQAAIDENTKLILLCSPGNTTSKVIPYSTISEILSNFSDGIVVVDESDIDFCPEHSALPLLQTFPNLIILRTLSKAFGVPGLRLGMAFGIPDIISLMNKVKSPYNISTLTIRLAFQAFGKADIYHWNVLSLLKERDFLLSRLKENPAVRKVYPSDTNFILFEIPKSFDVFKGMKEHGVVCRYRGNELHCCNCIRVAVGTHEENEKFLNLLKDIANELAIEQNTNNSK